MRWSHIYLANKNYGRGALGSDRHAEIRRDQGHLGVHLDPARQRPLSEQLRAIWRWNGLVQGRSAASRERRLRSISESDDSNVFGGFNGQDAPTMRAWNVQADIQRRLDFLSLNKLGETPLWGRLFRRQEWFCAGKQRRVRNDACALPWWLSQLPQRWCTRRCRQHDPSGKYVPQHTVCDPGYRF